MQQLVTVSGYLSPDKTNTYISFVLRVNRSSNNGDMAERAKRSVSE